MFKVKFWVFTLCCIAYQVAAHPSLEHRIEQLDLSIKLHPNNSKLYILRSLLHQDNQDWYAASVDLKNVKVLDSKNHELDFYFGYLAYQQQKLESAKQFLSNFLILQDTDIQLRIQTEMLLGEIDSQQNNLLSAAQHYNNVVNLSTNPPAHLYLTTASAYLKAEKNQLSTALNIINKGLKSYSGYLPLLELKIHAYQQSNNHAAMKMSLQSLLKEYPKHPKWSNEWTKIK